MDPITFLTLFVAVLALLLAVLAYAAATRANERHAARDLRDACNPPRRPTEQPKLNEPGDPDWP